MMGGMTDTVLASGLLDPTSVLQGAGPWMLGVLALFVFIESGCLFPFLPGDSLLFVAGMLAPAMHVNLALVVGVVWIAAICGDQVGFFLGRRYGRRFFTPEARVLTTERLSSAEEFFARHGGKSLFLARFVPIVRTFTPLAVGIAGYPYRRFVGWNIAGAVVWGAGVTVAGYFLGSVAVIRDHVDLWALAVVAVSLVPVVVAWLGSRRHTSAGAAGAAGKATAVEAS